MSILIWINPCGYAELQMTDLHRLAIGLSLEAAAERLLPHFLNHVDLTSD
jgi:lipoate-protein ligase B